MGVEDGRKSEGIENENKRYRIAWRSKTAGTTGQGEYMDKKTAEAWLNEANEKRPELEHWLEPENS